MTTRTCPLCFDPIEIGQPTDRGDGHHIECRDQLDAEQTEARRFLASKGNR